MKIKIILWNLLLCSLENNVMTRFLWNIIGTIAYSSLITQSLKILLHSTTSRRGVPQLLIAHFYGISQLQILHIWYMGLYLAFALHLSLCPKSTLFFWAINFDMCKYKIYTSCMKPVFVIWSEITLDCEKWFWKNESNIRE